MKEFSNPTSSPESVGVGKYLVKEGDSLVDALRKLSTSRDDIALSYGTDSDKYLNTVINNRKLLGVGGSTKGITNLNTLIFTSDDGKISNLGISRLKSSSIPHSDQDLAPNTTAYTPALSTPRTKAISDWKAQLYLRTGNLNPTPLDYQNDKNVDPDIKGTLDQSGGSPKVGELQLIAKNGQVGPKNIA